MPHHLFVHSSIFFQYVVLVVSFSLPFFPEMASKNCDSKKPTQSRRRRRQWNCIFGFYALQRFAKPPSTKMSIESLQKSGGASAVAANGHTWYDDANYIWNEEDDWRKKEKKKTNWFLCWRFFFFFRWIVSVNHDLLNLNFKWSNALSRLPIVRLPQTVFMRAAVDGASHTKPRKIRRAAVEWITENAQKI